MFTPIFAPKGRQNNNYNNQNNNNNGHGRQNLNNNQRKVHQKAFIKNTEKAISGSVMMMFLTLQMITSSLGINEPEPVINSAFEDSQKYTIEALQEIQKENDKIIQKSEEHNENKNRRLAKEQNDEQIKQELKIENLLKIAVPMYFEIWMKLVEKSVNDLESVEQINKIPIIISNLMGKNGSGALYPFLSDSGLTDSDMQTEYFEQEVLKAVDNQLLQFGVKILGNNTERVRQMLDAIKKVGEDLSDKLLEENNVEHDHRII